MELMLVFGRLLFSAASNAYQKYLTIKGLDPFIIVVCTYMVISCFSLPFVLLLPVAQLTNEFWANVFIASLLDLIGNFFLVLSLSRTDLSVFGPLNAYKVIFTLLFAAIYLGEIPDEQGITGIVIIVIGSFFLAPPKSAKLSSNRLFGLFLDRGVQYRFLSIIFFSIGTVFLKGSINASDPLSTLIYWCIIGLFLSIIFIKLLKLNSVDMKMSRHPKTLKNIIILGCLIFAMQYCTLLVFSKMLIAYSLALFQLGMLIHIFLGYKFFNEKGMLRKIFSAVIMVFGSYLILEAK